MSQLLVMALGGGCPLFVCAQHQLHTQFRSDQFHHLYLSNGCRNLFAYVGYNRGIGLCQTGKGVNCVAACMMVFLLACVDLCWSSVQVQL